MSENPPTTNSQTTEETEEERRRLEEKGRRYLEKRRRNSQAYRDRLKTKGVVSTTIRLPEKDLEKVRMMAKIAGCPINDMFLDVLRQGMMWRREILVTYLQGKIGQENAVRLLNLNRPSDLSQLLALEGLPIPISPEA